MRGLLVILVHELTTDQTKMRLWRSEPAPVVCIADVVVKGVFVDAVAKLPREHVEERLPTFVDGERSARIVRRRHGSRS
jgi:hypothetical protein